MNLDNLTKIVDFANHAKTYVELEQAENDARNEYIFMRNKWIRDNLNDQKYEWDDVVSNDYFIAYTQEAYLAFKDAKRECRNAKSRMMTRFRKLGH